MALDGSLAERGANGESIAVRDQAVRRRILAAAALLSLSLLASTLLASTARFFWFGELAVHFPVQYAGLALIAFVLFVVARRPGWAALALGIAAFNVMSAAPELMTRPPVVLKASADAVHVRLASINVLYSNRDYPRVADFIRRERPDAVVLVEMNSAWRRGLATVEQDFPFRYQTQGPRGRGVNLWSRVPFKDAAELPIEVIQEPAIQATLMVQGRPLRLFAVHATWPMAPASAARRNRQLALMAQLARATKLPLVALGDFNLSPFSPHFRQLLKDANLRSVADGFGWQPTWPAFLPPAGIQIDHGFVSPAITVQSFRRGSRDGSDHRPIVFDLML
jgi:endonuclease/exonuclease/phosphatase (EEP) superfamily protein YafD